VVPHHKYHRDDFKNEKSENVIKPD